VNTVEFILLEESKVEYDSLWKIRNFIGITFVFQDTDGTENYKLVIKPIIFSSTMIAHIDVEAFSTYTPENTIMIYTGKMKHEEEFKEYIKERMSHDPNSYEVEDLATEIDKKRVELGIHRFDDTHIILSVLDDMKITDPIKRTAFLRGLRIAQLPHRFQEE